MDNTEFTDDSLEERAKQAARKLANGDIDFMSINDWEALHDCAWSKLLDLDPMVFYEEDDDAPF